MIYLLQYFTYIWSTEEEDSSRLDDIYNSNSGMGLHFFPKSKTPHIGLTKVKICKFSLLATIRSRDFHVSDPGFFPVSDFSHHCPSPKMSFSLSELSASLPIHHIRNDSFQDSIPLPFSKTIVLTWSGPWRHTLKERSIKQQNLRIPFSFSNDQYFKGLEGRMLAQSAYSDLRAVISLPHSQFFHLFIKNDGLSQNLNYLSGSQFRAHWKPKIVSIPRTTGWLCMAFSPILVRWNLPCGSPSTKTSSNRSFERSFEFISQWAKIAFADAEAACTTCHHCRAVSWTRRVRWSRIHYDPDRRRISPKKNSNPFGLMHQFYCFKDKMTFWKIRNLCGCRVSNMKDGGKSRSWKIHLILVLVIHWRCSTWLVCFFSFFLWIMIKNIRLESPIWTYSF